MEEKEEEKTIFLTSCWAEQMAEDELEEERKLPLDQEEIPDDLTENELFEALIKKYTQENRGIKLLHDLATLEELGFFLNEETRRKENYVISCHIKSTALRNEIKRLFGIDLQMNKTLVSMKPGDILYSISVRNLPKAYDYKEDYLPQGSKLRVKMWRIIDNKQ